MRLHQAIRLVGVITFIRVIRLKRVMWVTRVIRVITVVGLLGGFRIIFDIWIIRVIYDYLGCLDISYNSDITLTTLNYFLRTLITHKPK